MGKRLRVAVVGTGAWWGFHPARVFSARPDVALGPIVGRDRTRTADRAELFATRPYVDIKEMLSRERPDLVSVCLPNEGHFAPTLDIIRSGCPLFVEKPLVFDLDEAQTLIAEAE